jgi:hypothetical protein
MKVRRTDFETSAALHRMISQQSLMTRKELCYMTQRFSDRNHLCCHHLRFVFDFCDPSPSQRQPKASCRLAGDTGAQLATVGARARGVVDQGKRFAGAPVRAACLRGHATALSRSHTIDP